jgi:hypothetical protein
MTDTNREALIRHHRRIEDNSPWESLKAIAKDTADMLEADAVRSDKLADSIAADRNYWREKALQVAVPLTEAEKSAAWLDATIEMVSHENCYFRGMLDAERHHGIGVKK